ncbi:MAG: aldo/keto reductase, partial [Acidobacteria bacterium]|nr:aldo/keto reductase [Acidobacteriota bacterium]
MSSNSSRRSFLAAGLTAPAALASPQGVQKAPPALAPTGTLSYRTLGKTGLKVTSVSFGCMVTSDPTVISRAVDMGVNYFDTARRYGGGNNERMVGSALKSARNRVLISSKSHAMTAVEARNELETSLRELGTDYLDIWYMHFRDEPSAIPDEVVTVWEEVGVRTINV